VLARIFWDEPRDLRLVENSFIPIWKCGRVRIFDVGFGLYQFIFPLVSKRTFVLENQPWFFQRAIIHFTDTLSPSEELFDSLQFMLIWVKIIGMPFACRTVAIGRKLLAPMGEVVHMGYFDAHKPEGCYVKVRVRMDLFSSFLGTALASWDDGTSFKVFFQYEGVPCICYLCGFLGHVMGECSRTDVEYDPLVRGSWICGVTDPDEEETEGLGFQRIVPARQQARWGRGGLPPSVVAGLSSNLHRQWAQERRLGGRRRGGGHVNERPRPFLALPGPTPILQVQALCPPPGPNRPPVDPINGDSGLALGPSVGAASKMTSALGSNLPGESNVGRSLGHCTNPNGLSTQESGPTERRIWVSSLTAGSSKLRMGPGPNS
ncbi:hypothetical protein LINPERPRIM_LOCUS35624, partial [Linum perenne]